MTNSPENHDLETVLAYHERTKHRFDGYAKGPETIDWDAQPNPFRHYEGAPQRQLPLIESDNAPPFSTIATGGAVPAAAWDENTISLLLQYALGIAAWKQYGKSRWSLRCNPSSGNLHPTECYPILLGIEGFEDGLYHYLPETHRLELRCRYSMPNTNNTPTLLLGLSSLQWREAWKYGERAYRYCQLDAGHALAAISYSAATLGHHVTPILDVGSGELEQIMGLDRQYEFFDDESEAADLLLALQPMGEPVTIDMAALKKSIDTGEWRGKANRIDPRHHYEWPIIDVVTDSARRPAGAKLQPLQQEWPAPLPAAYHPLTQQSALKLFVQRRSAQAFDASGRMGKGDFFRLLDRILPRAKISPWSSQSCPSCIHLLMFVHAVDGLSPGLYLLARQPDKLEMLREELSSIKTCEAVEASPPHLPLYQLVAANARKAAMKLSCLQEIAGDSVFSAAMLAEFEPVLSDAPWRYNELLWEAGMVGHTLYLEAEAIGYRGTGIGCFFDDGVHEMLGVKGKSLQTLYHFTVGVPLVDERLVTLPGYGGG